jgi:hypothetical protein
LLTFLPTSSMNPSCFSYIYSTKQMMASPESSSTMAAPPTPILTSRTLTHLCIALLQTVFFQLFDLRFLYKYLMRDFNTALIVRSSKDVPLQCYPPPSAS